MNVFYLISIIIGVAAQNFVKKPYSGKTNGKGVYIFSVLTSVAALGFFIVSALAIKGRLEMKPEILPYAFAFAISYAAGTVGSVVAISCGSLSITSLIISYSLMIPSFYGICFIGDPISKGLIPGIILLVISLVLINKRDKDVRFSLKWLVSVALAFLGNGFCSVTQKMQQIKFNEQYKDEFMIMSLSIVVIIIGILVIFNERKEVGTYLKKGWYYGLVCGIMNGMVNLFVMILSEPGRMPVSLMFPMISAGGIIVTYAVSRFIYKESLTKTQFVGFILGVGSVVLLNI